MSDASSPPESRSSPLARTSPPPAGATPDVGPAPGEVIASKYVVESLLGIGGMGVVLAARHLQLNQRVALKLLRKEAAFSGSSTSRFLREARAAAALTSEHVARVLDVGTLESGLPFIVMEYLSGSDLAGLLEARQSVPYPEAVSLVLQACEAIAEAHSLGIIHRDLKPSNVFVTHRADGSALVKVLDFGISKFQNPLGFAGDEATLTASGSVVGSPAYMSPEQIRSAKKTDARSDVWAMGVILYELITGWNPFIGETIGDTLVKIASEPVTPVRDCATDVPAALAAVIERCLERAPDARTGSIAELAQALEPFAAGDASAFVARIVRVSASTRPFSVTPSSGDPLVPGGAAATPRRIRAPHETEAAWQRLPSRGTRGGSKRPLRWALGLGAVGAAALGVLGVRGSLRPASPPPLVSTDDSAPSAARPAVAAVAPAEPHPELPDATVAASPATASPASSAAPLPAHPGEHRRPHHPPSTSVPPATEPPVRATGAPPVAASAAASARSFDDLLEGRH